LRYLLVNADDFGFTRDVNLGIVEAHVHGILTATTLMATGPAFDHAVSLATANPTLDIGVHLQMVQGPSLSRPGKALPDTVTELLFSLHQWDIQAEINAQIEKILATGIRPTHLDTHKHTHLLPPILKALAQASQTYQIPFIRRPFDLPLNGSRASLPTRLANLAMQTLRPHFRRTLQSHNARSTDHFAGFLWTGNYTADDLLHLFSILPPGSTELMTHPGHLGPELRSAPTRLKQSRYNELTALTDPRLKPALAAHSITLTRYHLL
jgi:predicted glycoside hydrolase/deacetylase ChbG (UPF0249 family)